MAAKDLPRDSVNMNEEKSLLSSFNEKSYSPKKGTTSLEASKNGFVSILLSSGIGKNAWVASEKNDMILPADKEISGSFLSGVELVTLKHNFFRCH